MDHISALDQATDEFLRRATSLDGTHWTASTVCDGWNVTTLVEHVVGGCRMAGGLLAGASKQQAVALLAGKPEGDPVASLRTAFADQAAAFATPGALEMTVHHPSLDMSGEQLLGFRTLDIALHAWDLSRSVGLDEQLDPELVAVVWEFMQPIASIVGSIGVFGEGPSGNVPESADLQTRLIDLVGRRP